jgi:hypothetical protein
MEPTGNTFFNQIFTNIGKLIGGTTLLRNILKMKLNIGYGESVEVSVCYLEILNDI